MTMKFKSCHDIRRDNLREIIKARFNGVQEKLAAALEKTPGSISRVMKEGAAQPRGIGTALAREIEEKLELVPNWLDNDHNLISGSIIELPAGYNTLKLDLKIITRVLEAMDQNLSPEDEWTTEERADFFARMYRVYEGDPQTMKLKTSTAVKLSQFEEKEDG